MQGPTEYDSIATRYAVVGDLATLDTTVLERFRADIDAERSARIDSTRLELSAIRQIVNHLRGNRPGEFGGLA